ncbi:MAG TPA: cysteine-rich CWC family protein [Polyangiaceae bacterium]|jgi:hypothetical protein
MTSAVDPSLCPVCGEPNTCGMSQGKSECWCTNLKFPQAALDRIPADAKNLVCICPRCAQAEADAKANSPSS